MAQGKRARLGDSSQREGKFGARAAGRGGRRGKRKKKKSLVAWRKLNLVWDTVAKVKLNVHCRDNMVIQAIFLLDTLDKAINSFPMRVREWYSWHFPELVKIINDNYLYAKVAQYMDDKSKLAENDIPGLTEIVGDEDKSYNI